MAGEFFPEPVQHEAVGRKYPQTAVALFEGQWLDPGVVLLGAQVVLKTLETLVPEGSHTGNSWENLSPGFYTSEERLSTGKNIIRLDAEGSIKV